MMIVEAIRSAATPHAVYFLVTAYIESLRHFERSSGVPTDVLNLPIGGLDDLEERVRLLHQRTIVSFEAIVPVSELAAVLACAVERTASLEQSARVAVMPPVRNDSRRSALSV